MTTYKIKLRYTDLSNSILFDVAKNGRQVSTYMDFKNAILKVYNDLTGYKNCKPETLVKNSYRRSKLNNINFIG